jgi:hypothetical protein
MLNLLSCVYRISGKKTLERRDKIVKQFYKYMMEKLQPCGEITTLNAIFLYTDKVLVCACIVDLVMYQVSDGKRNLPHRIIGTYVTHK